METSTKQNKLKDVRQTTRTACKHTLKRVCVAVIVASFLARQASALSLMDVYQIAQHEDPTLAGSRDSLTAAEARLDQSGAKMRPQLALTASGAWNHRDYTTLDNSSAALFSTPEEIDEYPNGSGELKLTQPIWNRANSVAVGESLRAAEQSQAEYQAARQDMLVRLMQAWFDSMLAADDLGAARQKVAAAQLFWQQAKRGAALELIGPEKLADAQARFESAVADRMAALEEEDTAQATLEEITGPIQAFTAPLLAESYVLPPPSGAELDDWITRAEAGPLVQGAREALLAADEEIRKQEAGRGLTVDLFASLSRDYQKQGNFPGQQGYDIKQRAVGVEFALPLYSGGGTSAKIREALALRDKADEDLLAASRKARATAVVAWSGWRSGVVRIEAARQQLHAAEVALQVARSGSQEGLNFALDVLKARENLYKAHRDLQKARYEAIMSRLKLKALAGELGEDDVRALDRYMEPRPKPDPRPSADERTSRDSAAGRGPIAASPS